MRILPIFIPHAGCQRGCVYCNQATTSQRERLPAPDAVAAEVELALSVNRLDEIAFYGGSFTALTVDQQEDYLGIIQPHIASGSIGGIRVSTRPDALSRENVALLDRYGVQTVELGCQSFSDRVLVASGRGHSASAAQGAVLRLRQQGVRVGIQLMPGLPGADAAEAICSLNAALALSPDFLRIYPTVVLAGTPLADLWRSGAYEPLTLEATVELCADMELLCRQQGVPVIRYGLQANDLLAAGGVLAGPYHPAFGQLVRSRLWRRALKRLVSSGHDVICVHPADLSDAVGHARGNIRHLIDSVGPVSIRPQHSLRRGFLATARGCQEMQQLLATGIEAEA